MTHVVPFYNLRDASQGMLERLLVGRKALLNEIFADLERQATSSSRQHWLIRGSRGIGKTHLAGIVYHRVCNHLFTVYLPIWLGEADVYEVYSAGTLLLRIAERLTEELRLAGDLDAARAFNEELCRIEGEGDDVALFNEVCELLQQEANKRGKILLILMENLDALLDSFAPRIRPVEKRRFRSLLSHNREFLFISTTPTQYLSDLSDPNKPLYGQMKERKLLPLTEAEVSELFTNLGEVTGRKDLASLVTESPEARVRQHVIYRLTKGIPRSVVMAFEVMSGERGVCSIVEDLRALLEAQTAYFEERFARIPSRERAIVAAMALAPENKTIKEIAGLTRLSERSLSTLVARLVDEGHLEPVGGSGGKGTVYALSDGLFRVWYQLRKGHQLLEPLVHFLAFWHQPEELRNAVEQLRLTLKSKDMPRFSRKHVEETLRHLEKAYMFATSEIGRRDREQLWAECRNISQNEIPKASDHELSTLLDITSQHLDSGRYKEAIAILLEAINQVDALHDRYVHRLLINLISRLGTELVAAGSDDQVIKLFHQFVERFEKSEKEEIQELVLHVMISLGITLDMAGRYDKAIETFQQIIDRLEKGKVKKVEEELAHVMIHLGIALSRAGCYDKAIETFQRIVDRFTKSKTKRIRETVVHALLNLGITLREVGRYDEAIETLQQVTDQFIKSKTEKIREIVAYALFNLSMSLNKTGHHNKEIEVFQQLIDRFRKSKRKEIQKLVSQAMVSLGIALGKTGHYDEAIESFHQVTEQFENNELEEIQKAVAHAKFNLGIALSKAGRRDAASKAFRQFIEQFEKSEKEEIQEMVADAITKLGIALGVDGRYDEAIETFQQVIERFAKSKERKIQKEVAHAISHLDLVLDDAYHHDKAIEMFQHFVERFEQSESKEIQERVPHAMVNLGIALGIAGQYDNAIEKFQQVVTRFKNSNNEEIQKNVRQAMLNRSVAFCKADRHNEESEALQQFIERYEKSERVEIQAEVAHAMINRGAALGEANNHKKMTKVFQQVVERFGESKRVEIQEQVAHAMNHLGVTLRWAGRHDKALEQFQQVIKRFGKSKRKGTQELVNIAQLAKGIELAHVGRLENAEEVINSWVKTIGRRLSDQSQIFLAQAENLFLLFPVSKVHRWLSQLQEFERDPKSVESIRLHLMIAGVLQALEPAKGDKRKGGPAARYRQTLSRVPPELRQTIEEIVTRIRAKRSS